ncbi:MAG: signal recognition particle-docking protein FtsY [bacterium]
MIRGIFARIKEILRGGKPDATLLSEVEELLLSADVGVKMTEELLPLIQGGDYSLLKNKIIEILSPPSPLKISPEPPTVYLFLGVNGTGKTTTIAKLAYRLKKEGKESLLVAGDTFRAAAAEQLEEWGRRIGVDVIKQKEGADPAAVVFDALSAGKARGIPFILIDTAGRLHTKSHLLEELRKINRVIEKQLGRKPDESLLVLDATIGQNAIQQARVFLEACDVTGIVLCKYDGTAKGGAIIPIKKELGIPIKLLGIGEKMEDLIDFDPVSFTEALFSS